MGARQIALRAAPFFQVTENAAMTRVLFFVVPLFVAVMLSTAAQAQQSTQSEWRGEPKCGGINLQTGKILPACGFSKAKFSGKARKNCPSGTFFDLGAWACFKCPSGFNRTANDIGGDAACSKAVPKQFNRAKFLQKFAKCPSGSFFDPRNYGECWKCPSGFGRTTAPVTEWDACGRVGAKARSAELVARVCPDGTFGDPRGGGECWVCPTGFLRTSLPVNGTQACYRTEALAAAERVEDNICKEGAFVDPIDGGTCWTCPEKSVRTVLSVKGPEACENPDILWNSPAREADSLFRIPGGEAVARALVADRTYIETASANLAAYAKADPATALQVDWAIISQRPHESHALNAAVFSRVLDAIKSGAKSKAERDLLSYFARFIQDTRRLNAIQIRDVYASWKAYVDERLSRTGTMVAKFYNIGKAPPDVSKVVYATMGITGAGMMLGGSAVIAAGASFAALKGTAAGALVKLIMPFVFTTTKMGVAGTTATTVTGGAAGQIVGQIAPQLVTEGVKDLAVGTSATVASLQAALAVAGPLIILTGAAIVGGIGIDIFSKNQQATAKILDAAKIAEKPVILKRLTLRDEGRSELLMNWMMMTQILVAPKAPFNVDPRAAGYSGPAVVTSANTVNLSINVVTDESAGAGGSQVAALPKASGPILPKNVWKNIDGNAHDVAIAADGTTYIVSTEGSTRTGFKVFKRGKNERRWQAVDGITALRIAVENKRPWVIDPTGRVFNFFRNKWQEVKGNILGFPLDIGASKDGAWITTTKGAIYRFNGARWQKVNGTARRIDVDWDGNPWIINNKGEIFVRSGNTWTKTAGLAVDVAVDMPGFARVVGTDGKIYGHNAGKWTQLTQNDVAAAIGVGGGEVWSIAKDAKLYKWNR